MIGGRHRRGGRAGANVFTVWATCFILVIVDHADYIFMMMMMMLMMIVVYWYILELWWNLWKYTTLYYWLVCRIWQQWGQQRSWNMEQFLQLLTIRTILWTFVYNNFCITMLTVFVTVFTKFDNLDFLQNVTMFNIECWPFCQLLNMFTISSKFYNPIIKFFMLNFLTCVWSECKSSRWKVTINCAY